MTAKTALIFGVSGQDGSLICKSLLNKGYEVIGLSRGLPNQIIRNHTLLGIENEVKIDQVNIEKLKTITDLIEKYKPNEIYNLAGQSSVGKSFIDPTETITSIVNGSHNLLEAGRLTGYTGVLFFAGSSEVFGNTEKPACIKTTHHPRSPYAIAKSTAFNLVKMYREIYQLKCMTGVLFNHESPLRKSTFVTQKIVSGAISCKENQSEILKLGNIEIARDWGWAEEYVEAIQLVANANSIEDQVICTGKLNSLKDFTRKVFNKLDLNWEDYVESDKSLIRKTEIRKSYGNPLKMLSDHKWESKVNLDSMIDKLIEFQIENH